MKNYTIKNIDGVMRRVYTPEYREFLRHKHHELFKLGDYRNAHKIYITLVRGWEHCRHTDFAN